MNSAKGPITANRITSVTGKKVTSWHIGIGPELVKPHN